MSDEQEVGIAPEVIEKATATGWTPKEQFRGEPSRWVDADKWVQRADEIMPILRQNNAKLLGEVTSLKQMLRESNEAIEALKETSIEITRERVAAAKKEVLAGIRQAREDGNVEVEDQLTDKLGELKAAEASTTKPVARTTEPQVDPAFTAWAARPENEWFGRDRRKTSLAMGIAQELREDPANAGLVGEAFYRRVAAEVDKTVNPRGDPPPNRVEGGRGGGGNGGGGGSNGAHSYNDLPADAKAACDSQGKRFVGTAGYKDKEAWREYYVKQYYAGEE